MAGARLPMATGRCAWLLTAVSLLLFLSNAAEAQTWSRFRGPNGSGEAETQFPATWSEHDYLWRVALPGSGHSSPVTWNDRVFLSSAEKEGNARLLLALDAETGKVIWKESFPSATHRIHAQNSFASSTPAVDQQHVYFAWTTPDRLAVAARDHDGQKRWQIDLGPFVSQHGFGTSPIVYQDMVIIGNDQDGESSLVALDAATGDVRWKVPRRTAVVAYSTPCVYGADPASQELIFNSEAHGISSINPRTGSTNWELEVFNQRTVSSPVVVGNIIFGTCGSGGGSRNYLVAVRAGDKPQEAYRIEKAAPYVPTPVARGELVFLWADNGVVTCIDAQHGDKVWQKRVGGNFSGSPIRAGDRLYAISSEGEVVVLAAGREYELLGRNALGQISRSTPAVAGGRMLLRTESQLFCLGAEQR